MTPYSQHVQHAGIDINNVRFFPLCTKFHLLAICKVNASKERIVFWAWLSCMVFIQEYRRSTHLHTNLLDPLLIVN